MIEKKELPKLTFVGAAIVAAMLVKKQGVDLEKKLKEFRFYQRIDAVEWAFRACPKDTYDIAATIKKKGYFEKVDKNTLVLWLNEIIEQLNNSEIELPMSWIGEIYSPVEEKKEEIELNAEVM